MQSVSSRIWTRVTVFISYDDNNYTKWSCNCRFFYIFFGYYNLVVSFNQMQFCENSVSLYTYDEIM